MPRCQQEFREFFCIRPVSPVTYIIPRISPELTGTDVFFVTRIIPARYGSTASKRSRVEWARNSFDLYGSGAAGRSGPCGGGRGRGPRAALGDGSDDQRLAALHVASREDAGHAGHPVLIALVRFSAIPPHTYHSGAPPNQPPFKAILRASSG